MIDNCYDGDALPKSVKSADFSFTNLVIRRNVGVFESGLYNGSGAAMDEQVSLTRFHPERCVTDVLVKATTADSFDDIRFIKPRFWTTYQLRSENRAPFFFLEILATLLAASLVSVATAQTTDLPTRKAAPIEYVRICDAYGSGFFYIPGTDTCLRVGGTVVGEYRAYSTSYRMGKGVFGQPNNALTNIDLGGIVINDVGYFPSAGQYGNATAGAIPAFAAVGRVDLDTRTSTPMGALRTFLRVDAFYGSEGAATGALSGGQNFGGGKFGNNTAFSKGSRETTILSKAFIQFAGLTAGRVQSFFDFYNDEINWEDLRGSSAIVGALAYTYAFGDNFSGTLSIEDNASRRDFIGSTIGDFNYGATLGVPGVGFGATYASVPGGSRVPEIVGNLRWDPPWGALQASGAAHQLRTSLYAKGAVVVTPTAYAFPVQTSEDYGYAFQLGAQFDLDILAPQVFAAGDKLWIQATYEKGATGYITGDNSGFNGGVVNGNVFYGFGDGGARKPGTAGITVFMIVFGPHSAIATRVKDGPRSPL